MFDNYSQEEAASTGEASDDKQKLKMQIMTLAKDVEKKVLKLMGENSPTLI